VIVHRCQLSFGSRGENNNASPTTEITMLYHINTNSLIVILQLRGWGVWVCVCTLFWAVPHGHETAGPNQTVLDVDAGVVLAV
jgi:hypothetical protein